MCKAVSPDLGTIINCKHACFLFFWYLELMEFYNKFLWICWYTEIVYILSGSLLVLPLLPSCNFCFFESGVDMEHLTFSRRATGPISGTLFSLPIAGITHWMVGGSELSNFLCTQKWKAYCHSKLANVALPLGPILTYMGLKLEGCITSVSGLHRMLRFLV